MRRCLSDLEIQRALGKLPGWARRGDTLVKSYQFASFAAAVAFVNRVAELAERMDHHPDLDLRLTKLTFTLHTYDSGGITQRDLDLAGEIERVASEPGD